MTRTQFIREVRRSSPSLACYIGRAAGVSRTQLELWLLTMGGAA